MKEKGHDLTHILKDSLLLLCDKDSLGSRGRNTEASQEAVARVSKTRVIAMEQRKQIRL